MIKKAKDLLKEIENTKITSDNKESYRLAIKRMKEVIMHLEEPTKKMDYIKNKEKGKNNHG